MQQGIPQDSGNPDLFRLDDPTVAAVLHDLEHNPALLDDLWEQMSTLNIAASARLNRYGNALEASGVPAKYAFVQGVVLFMALDRKQRIAAELEASLAGDPGASIPLQLPQGMPHLYPEYSESEE